MKISFTIYGEPTAKERPGFNGHHAFTPPKTRAAEYDFQKQALKHKPEKLLSGALVFTATFYRSIPKSFSKKQKQLAEDGIMFPTTRPDYDNYAKLACDAMNKMFFSDDAQIVDSHVYKRYSNNPRIEITVQEM